MLRTDWESQTDGMYLTAGSMVAKQLEWDGRLPFRHLKTPSLLPPDHHLQRCLPVPRILVSV